MGIADSQKPRNERGGYIFDIAGIAADHDLDIDRHLLPPSAALRLRLLLPSLRSETPGPRIISAHRSQVNTHDYAVIGISAVVPIEGALIAMMELARLRCCRYVHLSTSTIV